MDRKQDLYTRWLQETHFRSRNTHKIKVNGWKKIFHANGNEKKAGMAYLDKIHFKTKNVKRRVLHNVKGINPTRGYNTCKYLCIQHGSPYKSLWISA